MRKNNDKAVPEQARLSPSARIDRRQWLRFAGASLALMVSPAGFAAASLTAVRVWPATHYTRITLESNSAVRFQYFTLTDPERLVVDLEDVELNSVLRSLPERVLETDPVIARIRAARNRPGVIRVVAELKRSIKPSIFTLEPIANYGHRLVLDLYPTEPVDPLLALLHSRSPIEAARGESSGETIANQDAVASEAPPLAQNRLITVVIDAGHGGEDPGAIGRRGTYEKNVTLAIARRLQRQIDAEPTMQAVMTRNGDYFVPLQQRVEIARRAQADLFVSIHADAFVRPEAHGSSVYVLSESGATSSAARWLAQRENQSDLIGGVNLARQDGHLARTLLDLSQTATINDSLKLGTAMLSELGRVNRLHKPQVEQAGFAVLRAPDIPSILVETAFISNPEEERRLNDSAYQEKMAEALMRGIRRYFDSNPPVHRTTVAVAD